MWWAVRGGGDLLFAFFFFFFFLLAHVLVLFCGDILGFVGRVYVVFFILFFTGDTSYVLF